MHDAGRELAVIDAGERFYSDLTGVTEPEAKRDFLGLLLIECVEQAWRTWPGRACSTPLRGTLYPDMTEPTYSRGTSTVKPRRSVGGLPAGMMKGFWEPRRLLLQDEVRAIGQERGRPHDWVM